MSRPSRRRAVTAPAWFPTGSRLVRRPGLVVVALGALSLAGACAGTGGSPASGSGGASAATGGSGQTGGATGQDGGATGGTKGEGSGGSSSGGSTASGGTGGNMSSTGGRDGTATGGQTGGAGTPGSGGSAGAGLSAPGSGGLGAGGSSGGSGAGGRGGASSGGMAGGAGGTSSAGGTTGCSGLLCEDFESGSVDATKWDQVAKGGTLTIQQQRAAHGKYAAQLHAQSGASDDWALLVVKNVPAALKGTTTFGRAYVYLAPETTASIHIQFAFAGHNGTGSATGPAPFSKLRYMEVASHSGTWQLGFDLLDVSPLVEEVSYSKTSLPTSKWACLEWQFDDRPDAVTTWIDGTKVGTFDNTNVSYASPGPVPKPGSPLWDGTSTDLIGGFDTFGFGFHDWHPQKAFDVYYDDLVLDAKRVGCLQ